MSFPIIIWQIIIKTTISPGMDAWVGEGLLQALLQHIVPWLIQFPINGAGSPLLLWGKRGFAVIVMVLGICISKCGRDYYESVFFSVSLLVVIVFCRPTAYLLANQRTTPHSQSLHAHCSATSSFHSTRRHGKACYLVAQKSREEERGPTSYRNCAMNPVGLSKVVVLLLLLQIINTD